VSSIIPDSPAGSSPLVEQMPPDLAQVEILPAFGALLNVVLHSNNGPAEPLNEPVAAVTVYGDGRIEYHLPVLTNGGLS
jgi:hypothetical protein